LTPDVIALLVTLGVVLVVGLAWRWRRGRFTERRRQQAAVPGRLLADAGVDLADRATLVQFSSAFCAPCRATRQVLSRAAVSLPGVGHVEVDAESHLETVRALGVTSTPTTLVLDAAGRERGRAVGTPRLEQVLAVIGAVLADRAPTAIFPLDRAAAPLDGTER
jgi:hypothetical protein